MHAIQKIQQVLESGILLSDLVVIPSRGATTQEIIQEERMLSRTISAQHRSLLENWNGIGLEVLRLFGCGVQTGELGRLSDFQVSQDAEYDGVVIIGSDASGFAYLEDSNGGIYSLDSSSGELKLLATTFDSFICDFIFGEDGEQFAGPDWIRDLRDFGLV